MDKPEPAAAPGVDWGKYLDCPVCWTGTGSPCRRKRPNRRFYASRWLLRPHRGRPRVGKLPASPTKAVVAERLRVATAFIKVINEHRMCGVAHAMWNKIFPGIPLLDEDGYDRYGHDVDGFNRDGFKGGYDRDGYSPDGYDRLGFDRDGFNRRGVDAKGVDRDGKRREQPRRTVAGRSDATWTTAWTTTGTFTYNVGDQNTYYLVNEGTIYFQPLARPVQ